MIDLTITEALKKLHNREISATELPLRADVVTDGGIRDAILANAPDKAGVSRGYFAVPKVMEGD